MRPTPPRSIVALIVLCVIVFSIQIFAVVPIDSGGPSVLFPITINNGDGDQFWAHIDGDIAAYADAPVGGDHQISYYDFFTGQTHVVPQPSGFSVDDYISTISGTKIAFQRITVGASSADISILVYDIATAVTTELKHSGPEFLFSWPAIGGNTVAYVDFSESQGEVYVTNLANLSAPPVRLTFNASTTDNRFEEYLTVAPSGNLIVWRSCPAFSGNCAIEKATFNGSAWTVTRITSTTDHEMWVDTDGTLIAYEKYDGHVSKVCWQPAAGGTEQCLEMDGSQTRPSVSNGVIAFSSTPAGGTAADLYIYEVATNRRFRITSTDYPSSEDLSDITRLPDGSFRLVWDDGAPGTTFARNVYGATIELPDVSTPFNFSGFLQPVDPYPTFNVMKAGGAVPVRFSLGGFQGLSIFASGYPKSQIINCATTVLQADIEQTVTAGNSSLSYDSTTDQYSYIWKTDKSWAGTCRQLTIRFTDNTDHVANFKFK